MRAALLATFVLLLAGGCGAGGDVGAGEGEPERPQGAWQLVSGLVVPEGSRVTLLFEDGRVGGTAACNSYGASLDLDGERVRVGEIVVTEMACEPPVMMAEAAYLDALRRSETLRRDGRRLVLAGPDAELVFEPVPPVPARQLTGTDWRLDTLLRGEVASTPLAPGATLRLGEDGTLAGTTGCREFSGRWEARGDEVVATELAVREDPAAGACAPAAAEQDRHVLQVLGDGFRAEVEGDRLTLTGRDGAGLVLRAG